MITFTTATANDYSTIQDIAQKTWPQTFGAILSPEQIRYMLDRMYSIPALTEQVQNKKHVFLLAKWNGSSIGYASYEVNYQGSPKTKIHKLYLLPESQGKSIGKALIKEIGVRAKEKNNLILSLNVNRYNSAIVFYEKTGFTKSGEENIDIGNGYLMEDYIFEKQLQ